MDDIRTGYGYDVHALEVGEKLVLGGVTFEHPVGLKGHSDADVLLHAVMDALLGAAGMKDIGHQFPDTAPEFKGADSRLLLARVREMIEEKGFQIHNVDATLIAEVPKIGPCIDQMVDHIASDLQIGDERVSVKATTSETLGFIGREEGLAAMAVATVSKQQGQ